MFVIYQYRCSLHWKTTMVENIVIFDSWDTLTVSDTTDLKIQNFHSIVFEWSPIKVSRRNAGNYDVQPGRLVCLFVWEFSSHSLFHSFEDVTITGKGLHILIYNVYSACMAIEQWVFFNMPHLLWRVILF